MTRTDPPDILVSTVYREIKVSPMPGEPKMYRGHGECDTPSSLQAAQRDIGKRHCRSFDYLQPLESQPPAAGMDEEQAWRRAERRAPSPEVACDSPGRQAYLRCSAPDLVASRLCAVPAGSRDAPRPEGKKRGRSKSAPRVRTTYRAVPLELYSPEQARRGRGATRGPRDPHRAADGSPGREARQPARSRMDEVHPVKLQPQRAEAGVCSPLFVSDDALGPRAGVHVRYRVDMKPREEVWRPPRRPVDLGAWQSQPGRSLTVPSSRRPPRAQSPAGDYWTLTAHGCSPQPRRRAERSTAVLQSPYPEARSLPRPLAEPGPRPHGYASPLHYHDWWGTYRAAHAPAYLPAQAGSLSPAVSCRALATDSRYHSKSWDNILSPRRQPEFAAPGRRSYETLPLLERGSRSPAGRLRPAVVNLSRSPQRYAALSLSESSLAEKLQGEGGRGGPGRGWYVTPEITITDNELRAAGGGRSAGKAGGHQPADGPNGLSASFNDLLSCNLDKEGEEEGSAAQVGPPQLDDALADLVIDSCKAPASSGADGLLERLRKLIGPDDDPTAPAAEPPRLAGTPPSLSPVARGGPEPQARGSDDVDTLMCSNVKCGLTETLFNARLYFKSCRSCYTYYCCRSCRKEDWEAHKEACVYGRLGSTCKRVLRSCREDQAAHKAFSRIARMGYLSRGRGVLFLGFPNPASADQFLRLGLDGLLLAPTYLSSRELEAYAEPLGEYLREIQELAGLYNPEECFLLSVSVALGQKAPDNPSPRLRAPAVRRFAKIALASAASPAGGRKASPRGEDGMETLILTPPPGTADMTRGGEAGRRAREVCFINVQRELRLRGVLLRREYPHIYQDLCQFVESNKRFTPTTIYPVDKRTGRQFMCMIMAASEPLTLEWVRKPNVLEDMM